MFAKTAKEKKINLQDVIDVLQARLIELDPNNEEYKKLVDKLSMLYAAKKGNAPARVSPDAIVAAAASIIGVLLIINHERVGIVTSKALGFIPKVR
jgi:hypothetical protein